MKMESQNEKFNQFTVAVITENPALKALNNTVSVSTDRYICDHIHKKYNMLKIKRISWLKRLAWSEC